jgi:uncharacterized protein (TIGR03435 family)
MEESATEDQVRLMLQKLLQDRFKLSVHHETKELQGYRLLVAKSEPKIKAVPAQAEAPPLPDYLKGKPTAAFEDRIFVSAEGKGIGRFRLLSPELAAGIRRVKGLRRLGVRVGNWLTAEQGKRLLDATSDKGELAVIMATVIHALKCFCTSDETLRVHHQEFSQPRMGPGHSS